MIPIRPMIILRTVVMIAAIASALIICSCKNRHHSVTIMWSPALAGASPIRGYNVYRSNIKGGPYSAVASEISTTVYEDRGVRSGNTYYYVVTAVDQSGVESPRSEEISSSVP